MSDNFPDDIELSDNHVVSGQIVVSSKLRRTLEKLLPPDRTQYLPAKIINHKGRVAADDYCIVHLHDVCDCIDLAASQVKWNPLNKTKIIGCKSLVIKPEAIDDRLQAFRLKHWGSKVLARQSVVKALQDQRFIGLRFVDPVKFTGIG
jgi:hypothetical protein